MEDEYEKLIKFFDSSSEEKDKKLDMIFHESMRFFEKYKHVLKEGSETERVAMKKKMDILRVKIAEENKRNKEQLGLSSQEVKHLAKDPKNFSQSQWEFIQKAQKQIEAEKEESHKLLNIRKEERQKTLKQKKKKTPGTRKSNWLKS